jgi:hypothetical protein
MANMVLSNVEDARLMPLQPSTKAGKAAQDLGRICHMAAVQT